MKHIYIALLQGVNVGRSKRISMAELKRIVTDLGGGDVTTVVNSGNVVFTHHEADGGHLRQQLEQRVTAHVGQSVPVILRTSAEIGAIVAANPYRHIADTKCLHIEFLQDEITGVLDNLDTGQDHLTVIGREIYLHLPNMISGITYDWRTLSRRLITPHTSRNWNTVTKLATSVSMPKS